MIFIIRELVYFLLLYLPTSTFFWEAQPYHSLFHADVHLDCEARIAKFLGTPDSILYSYGLSTMFSAIPAFCKKGDVIVA